MLKNALEKSSEPTYEECFEIFKYANKILESFINEKPLSDPIKRLIPARTINEILAKINKDEISNETFSKVHKINHVQMVKSSTKYLMQDNP